jgi:uncharacterized protein Yka (UPF0111/DUF47 family)
MFSLQTIFGKGDKFFGLFESSAAAANDSARSLVAMLSRQGKPGSLDEFALAHNREKEIAAQIGAELVNTFVTVLDREDIERLGNALYKIPKTIQKFAERYALTCDKLGNVDFAARAAMLEKATDVLKEMVGELRRGMNLDRMKTLNDRMQAIESEADRLMLDLYRDLQEGGGDALKFLLRKDLFEILEKAIDRCRDVGNIIYQIVLKSS